MRVAVLAAVLALTACGGSMSESRPPAASLREWSSNVAIVLHQLRNDLAATQVAGVTPASARTALRNQSDMYALLVAYTDLAGCHSMVVAAGTPTAATRRVGQLLATACGHAERASTFFTRAVRARSGVALLAAAREARAALPALVRASLALTRVRALPARRASGRAPRRARQAGSGAAQTGVAGGAGTRDRARPLPRLHRLCGRRLAHPRNGRPSRSGRQ
jgi:hypothetical protein